MLPYWLQLIQSWIKKQRPRQQEIIQVRSWCTRAVVRKMHYISYENISSSVLFAWSNFCTCHGWFKKKNKIILECLIAFCLQFSKLNSQTLKYLVCKESSFTGTKLYVSLFIYSVKKSEFCYLHFNNNF